MKILLLDLQKAKDNIRNKIDGYPRVEQGNSSRLFSVRERPKHLHLNNTLPLENYT